MGTNAPEPPSRLLLLCAGVSGGFTIAAWLTILLGISMFNSIPPYRQAVYLVLGLCTFALTGLLAGRYALQRHRRNSWWDGFAAGDEPLAEVIPLRDLKGYEGNPRTFVASSPR